MHDVLVYRQLRWHMKLNTLFWAVDLTPLDAAAGRM